MSADRVQFLYREVMKECNHKISQQRDKKVISEGDIETPLEFLYWVRKSLLRCKETYDRVVSKIQLGQELGFPTSDELALLVEGEEPDDREDKKLIPDDSTYSSGKYLDIIAEITIQTFILYRALLQKITAEYALGRIRQHFGSLREWKRLLGACLTNKQAAEYAARGLIPIGIAVGIASVGLLWFSFLTFGLPILIAGAVVSASLVCVKYTDRKHEERRLRQNIKDLEEKQRTFLNQWEMVGEILSEQNLRYIIETLQAMTNSSRKQFEGIFDLRVIPATDIKRECPICYCPLTESDVGGLDVCSHIFHATCIRTWFDQDHQSRHNLCPVCQRQFKSIITVVPEASFQ